MSNEGQAGSDKQTAKPKTETPKSPQKTDATDSKLTGNMDFLLDIPLEISVELGRTKILINELLKLGQGSVIELSKLAGETLEILANQKLVARGEVVVVNEKYGVRLTEIISPSERIERLQ
jgi:flagellar motor switch protein FliN/FliY